MFAASEGQNILKQGELKRRTGSGGKLSAFVNKEYSFYWYVFGIRSRIPYLEYYDSEDSTFSGTAINSFSLSSCQKISYTLGCTNRDYSFCIQLQNNMMELTARTREEMLSWTSMLEATLHRLGILSSQISDHIYVQIPFVTGKGKRMLDSPLSFTGTDSDSSIEDIYHLVPPDDSPPPVPQEEVVSVSDPISTPEYSNIEILGFKTDSSNPEDALNSIGSTDNDYEVLFTPKGDNSLLGAAGGGILTNDKSKIDMEDYDVIVNGARPRLIQFTEKDNLKSKGINVSEKDDKHHNLPNSQPVNDDISDYGIAFKKIGRSPSVNSLSDKSDSSDFELAFKVDPFPDLSLSNLEGTVSNNIDDLLYMTETEYINVISPKEILALASDGDGNSPRTSKGPNQPVTGLSKPVHVVPNRQSSGCAIIQNDVVKPKIMPRQSLSAKSAHTESPRIKNTQQLMSLSENTADATYQNATKKPNRTDERSNVHTITKSLIKNVVIIDKKSADEAVSSSDNLAKQTDSNVLPKNSSGAHKVTRPVSMQATESVTRGANFKESGNDHPQLQNNVSVKNLLNTFENIKSATSDKPCSQEDDNLNQQQRNSMSSKRGTKFRAESLSAIPRPRPSGSEVTKESMSAPVDKNNDDDLFASFAQERISTEKPEQEIPIYEVPRNNARLSGLSVHSSGESSQRTSSVFSSDSGSDVYDVPKSNSPVVNTVTSQSAASSSADSSIEPAPVAPPRRKRQTMYDATQTERHIVADVRRHSDNNGLAMVPPVPSRNTEDDEYAGMRVAVMHSNSKAKPNNESQASDQRQGASSLGSRLLLHRTSESHSVITLKQTQVDLLKHEMVTPGGITVSIPADDCYHALALVNIEDGVWIAGWKQKRSILHSMFHLGDRLVDVNGETVRDASEAQSWIKNTVGAKVELGIKRVPHAQVIAIKRAEQRQNIGLYRNKGTAEIVYVDPSGLAAKHKLSSKAPYARTNSQTKTVGHCNWVLTEINNRPLNLFFKEQEIDQRLNAVGMDISIMVQPADFINELKKQLKKRRSYKDFIVQ